MIEEKEWYNNNNCYIEEFENTLEYYNKFVTEDDITTFLFIKEDINHIIMYIINELNKDSSSRNIRNLNIFIRRLFYGDTYHKIGETHSLSNERIRQICSRYGFKLKDFSRKRHYTMSFDVYKIMFG